MEHRQIFTIASLGCTSMRRAWAMTFCSFILVRAQTHEATTAVNPSEQMALPQSDARRFSRYCYILSYVHSIFEGVQQTASVYHALRSASKLALEARTPPYLLVADHLLKARHETGAEATRANWATSVIRPACSNRSTAAKPHHSTRTHLTSPSYDSHQATPLTHATHRKHNPQNSRKTTYLRNRLLIRKLGRIKRIHTRRRIHILRARQRQLSRINRIVRRSIERLRR